MKTDLIVLKTRLLKNYKHFEEQSKRICAWLDLVSLWGIHHPEAPSELKDQINVDFPSLELIIHE